MQWETRVQSRKRKLKNKKIATKPTQHKKQSLTKMQKEFPARLKNNSANKALTVDFIFTSTLYNPPRSSRNRFIICPAGGSWQ
jgi:hypothetical protein